MRTRYVWRPDDDAGRHPLETLLYSCSISRLDIHIRCAKMLAPLRDEAKLSEKMDERFLLIIISISITLGAYASLLLPLVIALSRFRSKLLIHLVRRARNTPTQKMMEGEQIEYEIIKYHHIRAICDHLLMASACFFRLLALGNATACNCKGMCFEKKQDADEDVLGSFLIRFVNKRKFLLSTLIWFW